MITENSQTYLNLFKTKRYINSSREELFYEIMLYDFANFGIIKFSVSFINKMNIVYSFISI